MRNKTLIAIVGALVIPVALAFGPFTTKKIDTIENNGGTDILLNPTDKVDIGYFAGQFALQSTADGELEESSITNTELGYVSGVTSSIQTQLDGKEPTLPLSVAGDILYENTGRQSLAIGTDGQLLTVSSGLPSWQDPPVSTTLDTKGQLQGFSTVNANVGPCTDDQILLYDALEATGWKCSALPSSSPTTTLGDIIKRGASEDERLGIGTNDQILTVVSGEPAWADAPVSLPDFTGNAEKVLAVNSGETAAEYVDTDSYSNQGLKNLFKNPSAELSDSDVDWSCTNGTILTSATNPLVSNKSSNNLSLGATAAGSCTATFTTTSNDKGLQGVFVGYFNASNNGIAKVQIEVDDVLQTELNITAAANYKKYEIPFVFGASKVEVIVDYNASATILMDELFAGHGKVSQAVGQAHWVGKVKWADTNCQWVTTNGTYQDFPVDNDCSAETEGDVLAPDTNIPAVKIPNARTDGYYRIDYVGMYQSGGSTSSATGCTWGLTADDFNIFSGRSYTFQITGGDTSTKMASLSGTKRFTTTTEKTVRMVALKTTGDGNCTVFGRNDIQGYFDVHFYPDSSATVVSQDTELTAETANEFTGEINAAGNAISEENFSIITTCLNASAGIYDCVYTDSSLFSSKPSVQLELSGGEGACREIRSYNLSTTGFSYNTFDSTGALQNCQVDYTITRGADFNKSATIIGKFENINDSETCEVFAANNDGTAITANTSSINWVEQDDTCGLFNGTQYVSNKDVTLSITGQVRSTAAPPSWNLILFRDGVADINLGFCQSDVFCDISKKVKTTAGEVLTIRSSDNFTLGQSDFSHTLQIKEMPSTASIVKNLLAEASQTKCQTKYLASDLATGTGDVSGLTFNGLTVGKKYSINAKMQTDTSGTGTQATLDWFNHPSTSTNRVLYLRTTDQSGLQANVKTSSATNSLFTAQETTLRGVRNITANVVVMGNGTIQETYVQLCQLPDTYVETTEW
jgi:hypothetical protein